MSLLESDSELYNTGISRCFISLSKNVCCPSAVFYTIITLLRNPAATSLEYKSELALVKSQNVDITNFEDDMNKFNEAGFMVQGTTNLEVKISKKLLMR
ncbi:MAG: DUF2130 domain-containing protein [Acidimicrobiia bacterium]